MEKIWGEKKLLRNLVLTLLSCDIGLSISELSEKTGIQENIVKSRIAYLDSIGLIRCVNKGNIGNYDLKYIINKVLFHEIAQYCIDRNCTIDDFGKRIVSKK